MYKLGTWIVHPEKFSIEHEGEEVKLKSQIMKLLLVFIESDGKALSKEELLDACWKDRVVTDDAVRQAIKELRNALNTNKDGIEYIQTIRRHGYRLIPEIEAINSNANPNKIKLTINIQIIFFIFIFITIIASFYIYKSPSFRISNGSEVITYDKKRELHYDKSTKGWDVYSLLKEEAVFGEKIIIRNEAYKVIHELYPSDTNGHVDNPLFSPDGNYLAYLDYSKNNCKINKLDVVTGKVIDHIICQPADTLIAMDWYSNDELFYSTSAARHLPKEVKSYNFKTQEQKQITSPSKGNNGDYFIRTCNEKNTLILRSNTDYSTDIILYNPILNQEQNVSIIDEVLISADWLPGCEKIVLFLRTKGIYSLEIDSDKLSLIDSSVRKVKSIRVKNNYLYLSIGNLYNKSVVLMDMSNDFSTTEVVKSNGSNFEFIKSPNDDRYVFISTRTNRRQVWYGNKGSVTQITNFDKDSNVRALAWSTDSKYIYVLKGKSVVSINMSSFKVEETGLTVPSLGEFIVLNNNEWIFTSYVEGFWQGYVWSKALNKKTSISNLPIEGVKKDNTGRIFLKTVDNDIYEYFSESKKHIRVSSIDNNCSDWSVFKETLYCVPYGDLLKAKKFDQNEMSPLYINSKIGWKFFAENESKFYFQWVNSGEIDVYKYSLESNLTNL